jgi:acyl-CoA synthetase (AMP-forming)/AMP-acid ligase II
LPIAAGPLALWRWDDLLQPGGPCGHRVIDTDMAAILYTSGSTGKPKGVVLSHRNMVAGAKSVASYLENTADDTLLAALPLSFDAGFSQLTTAFHAGARVVLLNYLLPQDVLKALARERVTGLTAVPPLYIQLSELEWPTAIGEQLRYFANTGGRMPRETLTALRKRLPKSKPYLMYGLTEAFRSTYLPPEEVDRRPDSIGKAIPNAEILVLRDDGTPCAAERTRRTRAPWRTGRHGLLERPRKDRRTLQTASCPDTRAGCRSGAPRNRRLLRRHGTHG